MNARWRIALAAAAIVVLVVGATAAMALRSGDGDGADPAPPAGLGYPPSDIAFAPDSVFDRRISADQPLDLRGDELGAELARQAREVGVGINTDVFSIPVYTVPADQPTVSVALDRDIPPFGRRVDGVPIPDDARPAAGEDQHLVGWQPSTDTMWGFWWARRETDGWHAGAAGVIPDVSSSDGVLPNPTGSTATGLAAIGGVITLDDLERGNIDHALAIAIPEPRANFWSAPANRTDGWVDREDAVPEGATFRLDPDLDLDALDLHPLTRMMAEAAQQHGVIVRDFAGSTVFFGEDPTPSGSDAWDRAYDGTPHWQIAQEFPWEGLQALPLELSTFNP
ncbi:MAG: hypothetical protein ACR2N6_00920 [Miltoncostaeaceae bacterium]